MLLDNNTEPQDKGNYKIPESLHTMHSKVTALLPEPFGWCQVDSGDVEIVDRNRLSIGRFRIAHFVIGKYPITREQFQCFIDATDGYSDAEWWKFSDDAQCFHDTYPLPQDLVYERGDLPRVRINWYEAMAFCRWLSAKTEFAITLPTEQQWQRAAIGDTTWRYPWGNMLDETRCNYGGNVGRPTPVTRYDNGTSIYGVYDMAGNVWEWTLSDSTTGHNNDISSKVDRVVRGGTWSSFLGYIRSIRRHWLPPDFRDYSTGFRVVSSPVFFSEALSIEAKSRLRVQG